MNLKPEMLRVNLEVLKIMDHDLRSPLQRISGYSEQFKAENKNYIQGGLREAIRVVANTHEIISQGPSFERPKFEELMMKFQGWMGGDEISVSYEWGEGSDLLVEVPLPVVKVLVGNVVDNALKGFRAKGESESGANLVVRAKVVQENEVKWLRLEFEDNGAGFSETILTEGFGWRRSEWQGGVRGTGRAMFGLSRLIEQYKGVIVPENVVDEAGNILGARVVVKVGVVN